MGLRHGIPRRFSGAFKRDVARVAARTAVAGQPCLRGGDLSFLARRSLCACRRDNGDPRNIAAERENIMSLTLLTILLMAITTYLTRIAGYALLHGRRLGPRVKAVVEAAPGCVLITVIAPHFVTTEPADQLALLISLLAAMRFSLLPVVIISVLTTAFLRHLL
ncbi:AzlD family protein [Dickeya fangzhongdai]|nr:AzlD family protein [Dickeya fangzhongdai]